MAGIFGNSKEDRYFENKLINLENENNEDELEVCPQNLDDFEIDGIDKRDFPDFCDAYFSSATIDGRELTDEELNDLADNYPDFLYEKILERLN